MPLYDFKCPACKKVFEGLVSPSTKTLPCPLCQRDGKRLLTRNFSAHYKGSGFYHTDYKKKD